MFTETLSNKAFGEISGYCLGQRPLAGNNSQPGVSDFVFRKANSKPLVRQTVSAYCCFKSPTLPYTASGWETVCPLTQQGVLGPSLSAP